MHAKMTPNTPKIRRLVATTTLQLLALFMLQTAAIISYTSLSTLAFVPPSPYTIIAGSRTRSHGENRLLTRVFGRKGKYRQQYANANHSNNQTAWNDNESSVATIDRRDNHENDDMNMQNVGARSSKLNHIDGANGEDNVLQPRSRLSEFDETSRERTRSKSNGERSPAAPPKLKDEIPEKQSTTFINTTDYDSLYEECNINDEGMANDATVDELFTSLLFKVGLYSPQSVIAPSLNETATSPLSSSNESSQLKQESIPILRHAYEFAKSAHEGQCRKSGEPYITHPLGVAHIIADMKLDLPSLLTALLHDTVEDTSVTLEDIANTFGEEIAQLVDGVTKVGKIPLSTWTYEEQQSENYRKLILSMSRDIRVLLVKLADRCHNMRTLQYMPTDKQRRIAKETIQIYSPLAHRLGIHWLKTELEDNCFKYLEPSKYQLLEKKVKGSELERQRYEEMVVDMLITQMKEAGLGGCSTASGTNSTLIVSGRTKGLYSIYSKMKRQDIEFDDVHDVIGFRIIVDDVASCYQALGIIHSHFKPVPGKIKDYIAVSREMFNCVVIILAYGH